MRRPQVFLWFIDGLGLGEADPGKNPLALEPAPAFRSLLAGDPFIFQGTRYGPGITASAVDATLQVPGLPQSATGQTTLLTGINASQVVGRHINGYPTPTLVQLLRAGNIFSRLTASRRRVTFFNAFTDDYLIWLAGYKREQGWANSRLQEQVFDQAIAHRELSHRPLPHRFRPSASTVAVDAAGLPLRDVRDLRRGEALFHDVTGASLQLPGLAPFQPHQAALYAMKVWDSHDLVFFETFLTDLIGHRQDMAAARQLVRCLDAFLSTLLAAMDWNRHLLVLISDHGNFEDLSVKTHTYNPVPFAAAGAGAGFAAGARSILDVPTALLDLLDPS